MLPLRNHTISFECEGKTLSMDIELRANHAMSGVKVSPTWIAHAHEGEKLYENMLSNHPQTWVSSRCGSFRMTGCCRHLDIPASVLNVSYLVNAGAVVTASRVFCTRTVIITIPLLEGFLSVPLGFVSSGYEQTVNIVAGEKSQIVAKLPVSISGAKAIDGVWTSPDTAVDTIPIWDLFAGGAWFTFQHGRELERGNRPTMGVQEKILLEIERQRSNSAANCIDRVKVDYHEPTPTSSELERICGEMTLEKPTPTETSNGKEEVPEPTHDQDSSDEESIPTHRSGKIFIDDPEEEAHPMADLVELLCGPFKKIAEVILDTWALAEENPVMKVTVSILKKILGWTVDGAKFVLRNPTLTGAAVAIVVVIIYYKQFSEHAFNYYMQQGTEEKKGLATVFPLEGVLGFLGEHSFLALPVAMAIMGSWATLVYRMDTQLENVRNKEKIQREKNSGEHTSVRAHYPEIKETKTEKDFSSFFEEGSEYPSIFKILRPGVYGAGAFAAMAGTLLSMINLMAYARAKDPKRFISLGVGRNETRNTAILSTYVKHANCGGCEILGEGCPEHGQYQEVPGCHACRDYGCVCPVHGTVKVDGGHQPVYTVTAPKGTWSKPISTKPKFHAAKNTVPAQQGMREQPKKRAPTKNKNVLAYGENYAGKDCQYGRECTRKACPAKHPNVQVLCRNGEHCPRTDCHFFHPHGKSAVQKVVVKRPTVVIPKETRKYGAHPYDATIQSPSSRKFAPYNPHGKVRSKQYWEDFYNKLEQKEAQSRHEEMRERELRDQEELERRRYDQYEAEALYREELERRDPRWNNPGEMRWGDEEETGAFRQRHKEDDWDQYSNWRFAPKVLKAGEYEHLTTVLKNTFDKHARIPNGKYDKLLGRAYSGLTDIAYTYFVAPDLVLVQGHYETQVGTVTHVRYRDSNSKMTTTPVVKTEKVWRASDAPDSLVLLRIKDSRVGVTKTAFKVPPASTFGSHVVLGGTEPLAKIECRDGFLMFTSSGARGECMSPILDHENNVIGFHVGKSTQGDQLCLAIPITPQIMSEIKDFQI